MRNVIRKVSATGTPPLSATLIGPLGRLRVDFIDALGASTDRLDNVKTDTCIDTSGTVHAVRLIGTDEEPRATLTLTSPTGDSAIVAVSADVYPSVFGDLVEGQSIRISGSVRRPFADMPPFIQLVSASAA
ncbi:hypothetical protein [Streptomyces sp. sk226]|uniref:hypothetical protein n=1 Tax=Streptomyces sp. sk226 TaxID=2034268 RepID=UPI0011870271|nr:hypothetical protein [Streptomyces sp. sk226]